MIADLLNFKKLRMAALYALVAALVVFFQDTIFARISLLGVKMLFVPAACAAVGMFEGGFRGGLFGLLAGFLCDTTYSENTVLFTVTFPIVGFCAGAASEFWLNRSFPAYLATAGAAILAVGLCQMVRVVFLDPGAILHCLLIVLAQTSWSLPMAAVVYYPVRWVNRKWNSE